MDKIEKIRAEIERQMRYAKNANYPKGSIENERATAIVAVCLELLSSLDTLSEESDNDLEDEIHKYNKERFDEYFPEQDGDFISEVDFMTCLGRVAHHFAQWGAEHLKK